MNLGHYLSSPIPIKTMLSVSTSVVFTNIELLPDLSTRFDVVELDHMSFVVISYIHFHQHFLIPHIQESPHILINFFINVLISDSNHSSYRPVN